MQRRHFIPCLNKEPKFYNLNYGTIVGGTIFATLAWMAMGFLWGVFAGGIGAAIGSWISREYFKGNLQRAIYWHLPYLRFLVDKNLPDSSNIHEL